MLRPRSTTHRWADWLIVPALAFGWLAARNGNGSLWMPVAAMTLAALCAAHVADALRTDSVTASHQHFDRSRSPLEFYTMIIIWALTGALSTAVAAGMWFRWMRRLL